jgi:5'(3')-deoxyribonucleotidase
MGNDPIANLVKKHGNTLAVALDVDQVMAHAFLLVVDLVNKQTDSDYIYEDLKEYPEPPKPFLNVTNAEFWKLYDVAWNEHWEEIGRLGEKKLYIELFSSFKVDIVSSRGEEAAEPLRKWMKKYYPEIEARLVVLKKFGDKSVLPYQVYIDDAPRLPGKIELMEGKLVLLVDAPYNRDIKESNKVVRVANVNDACRRLLSALKDSR